MLPRLYDSFDTVGTTGAKDYIGTLSHCRKSFVKEDRNGEYTVELETTVNDPVAASLISQRIIEAKPNPKDLNQFFEIQDTDRSLGGIVRATAKHVRNFLYQLESEGNINYVDDIESFSLTPSGVWNKLFSDRYITDSTPYTFTSDIDTSADFYLGFNEPKTLGAIFGGETGSMLDMYDGEFRFINYSISYLKSRGKNTDYQLRYGKNISSADQSESCRQAYSHVRPYGSVATADGRYINLYADSFIIPNNQCKTKKVFLLDCSEAVKTMTVGPNGNNYTEARALMTSYAEMYVKANMIGKTSVSIKVDTRAELEGMQNLGLCDTVNVILDNYGITTTAKIVSVTYNSLLERWESMTVGTAPLTLADIILNKKRYNL